MHDLSTIISNNAKEIERRAAAKRAAWAEPRVGIELEAGPLPATGVVRKPNRSDRVYENTVKKFGKAEADLRAAKAACLPTDAAARKALPLCTGVLDYFPGALAAVAEVSRIGNDQHNPGEPLHWAKGKSTDHADCALRHFAERGTRDEDGGRHTAKAAWRVLALLQMEIEAERAGLSFNDYIASLKKEAA